MTLPPIPLINLKRQIARYRAEIDEAMDAVIDATAFIQGPAVTAFEAAFLNALGAKHGHATSNGTTALSLILEALGIGPGDKVAVPSMTFIATAEAVRHVGAEPVFCDIVPATFTLDVHTIPDDPAVKAVMPVHLYGTPCDMAAVLAWAEERNVLVIEDAAQAHLATYDGACCGTMGAAGSFSFYPGKNLGAFGDAGFAVAREAEVAALIGKLLNHGRMEKYRHDIVGYNARCDTLQAAVLDIKLKHLPEETEHRRRIAALYDSAFKQSGYQVLAAPDKAAPVYHLYEVAVANRDRVQAALKAEGIASGIHYPVPLHRQPAFEDRQSDCPVSDWAAEHLLSIPICGTITESEAGRVVDAVLAHATPAKLEGRP